jgi:hypothetical protein
MEFFLLLQSKTDHNLFFMKNLFNKLFGRKESKQGVITPTPNYTEKAQVNQ